MIEQYEIIIASDLEHDKVFAEIYYHNKLLAAVSQEEGLDRLKLEFPGPDLVESMVTREVYVEEFFWLLNKAARKLAGEA